MTVNSLGTALGAATGTTAWQDTTSPVLGPQAAETAFRWATVTQQKPSLQIQLDGDSQPLPLIPESLIETGVPKVGARVWVQLFGRRVIVLGVGRTDGVPSPGDSIGWTPQFGLFSGVGPNWGSGAAITGSYSRIGSTITWQMKIVMGTGLSIGPEVIIVPPVAGPTAGQTIGQWTLYDVSTNLYWGGPCGMRDSGTFFNFAGVYSTGNGSTVAPSKRLGTNTANSYTGGPVGYVTETGDILSASGSYVVPN